MVQLLYPETLTVDGELHIDLLMIPKSCNFCSRQAQFQKSNLKQLKFYIQFPDSLRFLCKGGAALFDMSSVFTGSCKEKCLLGLYWVHFSLKTSILWLTSCLSIAVVVFKESFYLLMMLKGLLDLLWTPETCNDCWSPLSPQLSGGSR